MTLEAIHILHFPLEQAHWFAPEGNMEQGQDVHFVMLTEGFKVRQWASKATGSGTTSEKQDEASKGKSGDFEFQDLL